MTFTTGSFKKYLAWLPALCIAIAIFCFSSQPADDSTITSESISQILLNIANGLRMIDIHNLNIKDVYMSMSVPVRKSAHIIEFAALHLALLFALHTWNLRGKKWLRTALMITIVYACSDEIHQLFVPGRAGLVSDVVIDSLGAIIITVCLWKCHKSSCQ